MPSLGERVRAAPVTFALLAVNVAVFLFAERSGSTTETGTLLRFGASERVHVWMGEYWRLFTPMFLHIGFVHLLWNSYASVGWCTLVERALKAPRFLALYLLSGIGASCFSVLCHRVVGAGASGAMFGIIGATLVLRRRTLPSWAAFFSDKPTRSILTSIGIWTVIGVTALAMDNFAHLGGFVTGTVLAWVMTTRPRAGAIRWTAFVVPFAGLVLVTARPWWRPSPEDAKALATFGYLYTTGEGSFRKDPARGSRFLKRACEAGDDAACDELGGPRE